MRDERDHAIHPETSMGHVHLTTGDLRRLLHFYREVLGFQEARRDGETVFLSADGLYPFVLELTEVRGAVRPPSRTTGLYHAAILLPHRRELARVLLRLREQNVPVDGASDHQVSEAIYLRDPDGNGLELYADRARARWPRHAGQIRMTSDPLDIESLLGEVREGEAWTGMPPGARIGHVHLRVSDLARAEAFYHGLLGFDVTVREYPGALFLSAGGYHHHVAVNIWAGTGIPPAPAGSIGLRSFIIRLPTREELIRLVRRAEAHRVQVEGAMDHGLYQAVTLRDGDGIGVTLTVDGAKGRTRPLPWREEPLDITVLLRG